MTRRERPDKARAADPRREEQRKERRARSKAARERAVRKRATRRRVRTAGILAAAVLVVGLIGFAVVHSSSGGVAFAGDLRVGGTLKSLSLPSLDGEGSVTYDRLRDRPLVLNFFASWCPYCVGEMPGFQSVQQRLGDKVAFLGVSQGDSKGASVDLVHQTGVSYPTAIDAKGVFFNAIGTGGMPTTLFIEPGGRIAYIQVGPLDETTLGQYIQQYLGVQASS